MGVGVAIRMRVLFGKFLKVAILAVIAVALYWAWINREWILYNCRRQYDVKKYNLAWKTDLITAADKASKEKKELLAVYLKKGDDRSRKLISVLADPDFKRVENNYVMVLVEYNPEDLSPREKDHCEQMLKAYDIKGQYGTLVIIDPADISRQKEVRRVLFGSERALALLHRIAGGKFVEKEMVDSTPRYQSLRKKARAAVQTVENKTREVKKSVVKPESPGQKKKVQPQAEENIDTIE